VLSVALVFVLAWLNTGYSAAATAKKHVTHTVVIEGTKFEPATLTVRRGESIVWRNKDPFPHTVTELRGSFDSHSIAADRSWKYVPRKMGTFSYRCTLHPTMTATLIVE
jgi:plastocyanin